MRGLSIAYTSHTICEYAILSDGIYLALGYVAISEQNAIAIIIVQ